METMFVSSRRTFDVSVMLFQATLAMYRLLPLVAKIRTFPSAWEATDQPHWYLKSDVMYFCTGRVAFTPVPSTVQ